jgi:polyisoprenoid-binding protein YceI
MNRIVMRRAALAAACLAAASLGTAPRAAGPAIRYMADPGTSRLEFSGVQAGAQFKGVFHKFTAIIIFAPDALADARFDVEIDVNSLDSEDDDRDSTMRGADIFDVAHFPTAHYVTRSFTRTASGYTALGSLTLRGVTKEVPIDFQFAATGGGARLSGTAKLKRLDFGVGQGDWKSTKSVADAVDVAFALVLKPKPAP